MGNVFRILRQIYSGNYAPYFIRSTEFYSRYYKNILDSFFRDTVYFCSTYCPSLLISDMYQHHQQVDIMTLPSIGMTLVFPRRQHWKQQAQRRGGDVWTVDGRRGDVMKSTRSSTMSRPSSSLTNSSMLMLHAFSAQPQHITLLVHYCC